MSVDGCTDPYLLSNLLSFRLPLFPNLKIKLCSKLAADLSHDLLNGTLDMAFLTGMPETPRISAATVSDQPFFVAMLEDDEPSSSRSKVQGQLDRITSIGRTRSP
jgi:DNA-binding transcriptional LysR family regulator